MFMKFKKLLMNFTLKMKIQQGKLLTELVKMMEHSTNN